MNTQMRFEARFDDGDEDRWPKWDVIEWTYISASGVKSGYAVQSFPDQQSAEELAFVLNREHAFGEYA